MRAQITIFIIIGILALMFLGLTTYVITKTIKQPTTIQSQTSLSTYVTDCIRTVAKEQLLLIGTHGGHINPLDAKHNLEINTMPAEGDALILVPPKEQPVLYWWYLKSPNKCNECKLLSSHAPTLQQITQELEEAITKQLPECTNNFEQFMQQGAHVKRESIDTKIEFTKEDVRINVEWPITITNKQTETQINTFETQLKIPFKQIHEIAQNITIEEKEKAVIEQMILHMLGAFSGITPAKLPPMSAVTHDNNIITWNKNIVEQNIQYLLETTIPLITYAKPLSEKKRALEEATLAALRFGTDTQFEIRFHYFGWPIYFNITPEKKQTLEPDVARVTSQANMFPEFQTNTYEFFYDLSIPILVEIRDKTAYNGEGYSFFFAIETNIRDNKELQAFNKGEGTYGPFDSNSIKPEGEITTTKIETCVEEQDKTYTCKLNKKNFPTFQACLPTCKERTTTLQNTSINASFFCSPEQRTSGTTKITITDSRNNTPVSDAAISYGCGRISTCALHSTNSRGVLKTKLPICYNGHLRIEKQKYYPATETYTTEFEKRDELNIALQPLRHIKIIVKEYQTNGTDITKGPKTLSSTEQVIITLDRIKEKAFEEPFQANVQIEGSESENTSIIPGTYEVRAMLLDKKGIILPAHCIQICDTYDKEGKCKEYKQLPEKPQTINPALLGGIILNNNTGYFELTEYTLDKLGIDTIEFKVIKTQTPTCITKQDCILPDCVGIDESGKTEEYSKKFRKELKPEFLKT